VVGRPEKARGGHRDGERSAGRRPIRRRITILLLVPVISLGFLWGIAMWLATQDTLNINLLAVTEATLHKQTSEVFDSLQEERRATAAYLAGNGSNVDATALDENRKATDRAAAALAELVTQDTLDEVNSSEREWLGTLEERIGSLPGVRKSIDSGTVDGLAAERKYTEVINAVIGVFNQMTTDTNPSYGFYHQTTVALQVAREMLSQEDALLAGALARGSLTSHEYDLFVQRVGAQRELFGQAEDGIADDTIRGHYEHMVMTDAFTKLRQMEDAVIDQGANVRTLPFGPAAWNAARAEVMQDLRHLEHNVFDALVANAKPVAYWILGRTAIMIVLGIAIAVIAAILWRKTVRPLTADLQNLKEAAMTLAEERLPRVVALLQRGDRVDVNVEAPPLEFGNDELGDVGRAFNGVQQTAVQAAVDQAELRNGVREVFVNLARRSQGLVQRQLSLLDAMERRANDPEDLDQLFAIDHLATRMRRHAEDLIILSGAAPGRQWRRPVPVIDVIRSAVGEIEDYSRVQALPISDAQLVGRAVADVIHLLAELFENATRFSPPHTKVHVSGQILPNRYVVEIEDRGLGMTDEDLDRYNQRLAHPPRFNPSDTKQLGLSVVAQLAQRHGIKVTLRRSPFAGTTAIMLIPESLIEAGSSRGNEGGSQQTAPTQLTPLQASPTGEFSSPLRRELIAGTDRADADGPREPSRRAPDGVPRMTNHAGSASLAAVPDRFGRHAEPVNDVPATPAADAGSEEPGLPRRVRQASLAHELRETTPPAATSDGAGAAARPPEQIRAMMSAFQRGTLRGREDAGESEPAPNGDSLFGAATRAGRPSPRPSASHGEDQ
jgi:signal transduction histidine kinase